MQKVLAGNRFLGYLLRMETPLNYSEVIETLHGLPTDCPVRVEKKIAKKLLMENRSVHSGGRVFYLGIRDIGLGLCEVWKADLSIQKETKMFPKKK